MWEHSKTAVFCTLLGLSGCDDRADADADPDMPGRAQSSLEWRDCGKGQCAELVVPLDSRAPEAGTVSIAVNRLRADRAPYRGVLFVNPGGPGLPGKAFVEANADNLRAIFLGFDIIGFDPRGTGDSQGIHCATELDVENAYAGGNTTAVLGVLREEGERCAAANRPLIDHLGTNQVIDDVDRIRAALGSEELNFLGISYGTRLAAEYARTYPEHTRAVVLDATVPPSGDFLELVHGQFDALVEAHHEFFEACSDGYIDCPSEPERVFDSYLASLDPKQASKFLRIWQALLTVPFGPPILAEALRDGFAEPSSGEMDGAEAPLAAIDTIVNLTIHCTDSTRTPLTTSEAEAEMARFEAISPTFVGTALLSLACSAFPIRRDPVAHGAFTPRIAPLVVGGVADILTPFAWAEEAALEIRGASLLVSEHFGHSAMSYGGPCALATIRDFFVDPKPLPEGATCPGP
jgi:pimeloyl-ACP methyl ester carboxylesterase